ncbi:MAG: TonB-dependent receptor [Immundisolibacteraceae bacterium]|nr:TonB-dependent receptor [Immundisolibacteraceae bacterium]
MRTNTGSLWPGAVAILLAGCLGARAVIAEPHPLLDLSLEQLFELEVTSVNKTPQALAGVDAAVFVISANDIRRSTATSVPELLRLAPGVDARQIDASHWAVSIRGFNSEFSDKLLVLVDGVSVFSSTFSGVNWDELDMDLAEIDRIEVIRGPGAATWGANAVNGVINILTRPAEDTLGHRVAVAWGDNLQPSASLSHSGKVGDAMNYRVSGFFRRLGNSDGITDRGGHAADDDWLSRRFEFRGNLDLAGDDQLSLIIRSWNSQRRQISDLVSPLVPFNSYPHGGAESRGGTALVRLKQQTQYGSRQWQLYYDDRSRNEERLDTADTTLDFEFTENVVLAGGRERVWGLGYRRLRNRVDGSFSITLDPDHSTEELFTGFFQQSWPIFTPQLRLTLGSKFEHSSRVDGNVQPSVRLRYQIDPENVLWASVSRAVSTPALTDTDGTLRFAGGLIGSLPGFVALVGDSRVDPEVMIAYELGWRRRFGQRLTLDTTAFVQDYDDLLGVTSSGAPRLVQVPAPHVLIPFSFDNLEHARLYGLEVSGNWDVTPCWRLQGSYSFSRLDGVSAVSRVISPPPPEQIFNLSSHTDMGANWEFDANLRYNDVQPVLDVDSWWSLGFRLGWRATRNLTVSLVARELLDREHFEYNDAITTETSSIGRSALLQADWRY